MSNNWDSRLCVFVLLHFSASRLGSKHNRDDCLVKSSAEREKKTKMIQGRGFYSFLWLVEFSFLSSTNSDVYKIT